MTSKETEFQIPLALVGERGLLLFQLRATYLALIAGFEQYVGVSQARLMLLRTFFGTDELSQNELQQRLGVSGPMITRQVKRLEAEGYLTRRPDPRDNRFTLVALTDTGRRSLEEVHERGKAYVQRILNDVDDDQLIQMRLLLEHIQENIHAIIPNTGNDGIADEDE